MQIPSFLRIPTFLLVAGAGSLSPALHADDSIVTAVFSRSFNNYTRPVDADGKDKVMTYVVAKGGYARGFGSDASIDNVKFAGIVRILARYLAKDRLYPAKDGKKADLMLVIHWGKTIPYDGAAYSNLVDQGLQGFELLQQLGGGIGRPPGINPDNRGKVSGPMAAEAESEMVQGMLMIQFAGRMRDDADEKNANLLGYTADLRYRNVPSLFAGAGSAYYDLLDDVESERYYVAVTAYDFQDALRRNHKKGLWRTVVSIAARGNRFDEKLAAMLADASRYFGRDTGRLVRQFEYTPHVTIGDLELLGVVGDDSLPKK